MTLPTFADIFCGAGFFSLGFKSAGFTHVFGLDIWDVACKTYELNVGRALCLDIKKFDATDYEGKIDVVIGSPPCQTFSVANLKGRKCDMTLTKEFLRVVAEIKPRIWVMENVPNAYKFVEAPFKQVFDMSEYGLLQSRKRCFASNIPLRPKKEKHKYLSALQTKKLVNFREKVIYEAFPTITCRYNSFTKISPHIRDKHGIRPISHIEAMQIQTVPFNFKLSSSLGQRETEQLVGNGVPPLFAYKIAMYLKQCWDSKYDFAN